MKIKNIYALLSGCCIATAMILLATDLIIAGITGILIVAGIFLMIHCYK